MIHWQNPGDVQAVEPLLVALYDALNSDTGSSAAISEVLEALVKSPDSRALDVLVMIEAQMIDHDSPLCPARLPRGVITYHDPEDDSLHRAVPRELHMKTFDAMDKISVRLHAREELVTARLEHYRQLIMQVEIERIMPAMAKLLQDYEGDVVPQPVAETRTSPDMSAIEDAVTTALSGNETQEIDYETVRKEMEKEIREFLMGNEMFRDMAHKG